MQSAWLKSAFFYNVGLDGLRSGLSSLIAIKRESEVEAERFGIISAEVLSIYIYQVLSKECDDTEFGSSDWAAVKKWLLDRATEMHAFSAAPELGGIQSFKEFSGCINDFFNLARAACDASSVAPKVIVSSRKNIDSTMVANKIAEGLNKGPVGMALTADVDKVMARGELDEQCTGLMNSALSNFLADGMPAQEDGVYGTHVTSGTFKIKINGKCEMVDLLTEGLEFASEAISQSSLSQLEDEIEKKTLSGLMDQLALSIHCFDAARSLSAYKNLRLLIPELDEKLAGCTTEQEMAPIFKDIVQTARLGTSENEQCMKDFAFTVSNFVDKTMQRAKKHDAELGVKITVVKEMVDTWAARCSIREAAWSEARVLHRMIAADIVDEARMLEDLSTDGGQGYLSLAVELATLRRGMQRQWNGALPWANDYDDVTFVDHFEQDKEWLNERNGFFQKFAVGETTKKIIA
eukprot:7998900-Pyramimonas_sp.AAC.1